MESNDSPEIPDRWETSDIPGIPKWNQENMDASLSEHKPQVSLYDTHRSEHSNKAYNTKQFNTTFFYFYFLSVLEKCIRPPAAFHTPRYKCTTKI